MGSDHLAVPSSLPDSAGLRTLALKRHKEDPRAVFSLRELFVSGLILRANVDRYPHEAVSEVNLIFGGEDVRKFMAVAMVLDPFDGPLMKAPIAVCHVARYLLGLDPEELVLDRIGPEAHEALERLLGR